MVNILYHYCDNIKAFSILESATLRMSDVRKSNDYNELQLFFPDILDAIWIEAKNFARLNFKYHNKKGMEALREIMVETQNIVERELYSGSFSNFVVCFSESGDSLSQWRGYADDGQGCSIGFSTEWLQQVIDESRDVIRLEKVEYLTPKKFDNILKEKAQELIATLLDIYRWANSEFDSVEDIDDAVIFNFKEEILELMSDSLRYKMNGFAEEKEWRLFFTKQVYKKSDWVNGEKKNLVGTESFNKTINYLLNKIKFHKTGNDIVPFYPIEFRDSKNIAIFQMVLGPNNNISRSDIELFLKMSGYIKANFSYSKISYRKK